jgi:hypothetical protein
MDAEDAGDIGAGATGGEHVENFGPLLRQQLRTPSACPATLTSRLQAACAAEWNRKPA